MADRAMLPADAPAWQRHFHGDGYGYGWLLALIAFSLGFQMAAPEEDWTRVMTILLQGLTLVAALSISGVRRWLLEAAIVVAALALVAVTLLAIGPGDTVPHGGRPARADARAAGPGGDPARDHPPGAAARGGSRCGRCSACSASTC